MKTVVLLLLSIILQPSHSRSSPNADTYKAVVIEYSPTDAADPDSPPLIQNSMRYRSHIEHAGSLEGDIIVFPEIGLTAINLPVREKMSAWSTLIPLDYNPCENNDIQVHEALKLISCAARDAKIYTVINIAENYPCEGDSNCPENGNFYYNSQVVFDREGKIIARYRKTHLYAEPQMNTTPEPELTTFETDFGVTFGTFICFDILFKEPALTLTRKLNVTDFVYSTAWFSESPFLTAIQTQMGWAYAEDVTFLVAGYNRLKFSNSGSGIYLGRRGVVEAVMAVPGDRFIVHNVPKKGREAVEIDQSKAFSCSRPAEESNELPMCSTPSGHSEDNFLLFQGILSQFKESPITESMRNRACDGDFCCDYEVQVTNVDSIYKFIVFNGVRTFPEESVTVGVQTCGVVLCANDSITSCGIRSTSQTTFSSIRINATFVDRENTIVFPSSLDTNLLPLSGWGYKDSLEGDEIHVAASLIAPVHNLMTCGLYARKFDHDVL